MSGSSTGTGEFTAQHVRWRWLLLGAVCGAAALLAFSPVGVAAVGAALTLLGIAVFTWRGRRIGAELASAGLGILVPSAVPTLLLLLSSL
ncbi:hypothetical protein LQ384_24855 [Rhodococcus rhodochrous]|uniref:Uncharacterized protein n=1 Tax=Rhodococcus rhodochrous TaxID=1829 RepID=A0AAW4XN59_RHORH|nr:hypothetical protein [Rhodococcus rhodochrous]MCD2114342.1 hypothetical protein [Rhodococcus rhodochrous]